MQRNHWLISSIWRNVNDLFLALISCTLDLTYWISRVETTTSCSPTTELITGSSNILIMMSYFRRFIHQKIYVLFPFLSFNWWASRLELVINFMSEWVWWLSSCSIKCGNFVNKSKLSPPMHALQQSKLSSHRCKVYELMSSHLTYSNIESTCGNKTFTIAFECEAVQVNEERIYLTLIKLNNLLLPHRHCFL